MPHIIQMDKPQRPWAKIQLLLEETHLLRLTVDIISVIITIIAIVLLNVGEENCGIKEH